MNPTITLFPHHLKAKQRAFVVKQLALLLSSGVPLATALNLASEQTDNPYIRSAIRAMTKDVEAGYAFSAAAAKFPELFDTVSVAILKSGEASGHMQTVLTELAEQLEKDANFNDKIRNTLLYPGFVVVVMILVGIIMTTVIIPRLTTVFEDTNITLPITTRILVAISNAIIHYWYLIIGILVGLGLTLRSFIQTTEGKALYYRLQLNVPGIRSLVQNAYLVRFTRVLGMLVRSGVPITHSLELVAASMSNKLYVHALQSVKSEVEHGIPLSAALSRHSIFPKPLIQMITVGEQTGKLDEVLGNMEQIYEEETEAAVAAITSLIEPILLVIVALAAGFVIIGVILPIYGLAEQF